MKKLLVCMWVAAFVALPASAIQAVAFTDGEIQQLKDEADRNRQMLEIWKDHVRTLTRERDEATKQIEVMKTQGPATSNRLMAQGTEIQMTGPNPMMQSLQTRVAELQTENSALRGTQSQAISSQQLQFSELERQISGLNDQLSSVTSENDSLRADLRMNREGQSASEGRMQEMATQINTLKSQNESLKASQQEATAAVNLRKDLAASQQKVRVLESEIENATKALSNLSAIEQSSAKLRSDFGSLEAAHRSLAQDFRAQSKKIENADKLQVQVKQDTERLNSLRQEVSKALAERDDFEKRYQTMDHKSKQQDAAVASLSLRIAELEKQNREYAKNEGQAQQTVDQMRAGLDASASDLANLKANFNPYIDSLIQSFNQRRGESSEPQLQAPPSSQRGQ